MDEDVLAIGPESTEAMGVAAPDLSYSCMVTRIEWERVLVETVRPARVVAMHVPRPDAPGEAGTYAGLLRSLREERPCSASGR